MPEPRASSRPSTGWRSPRAVGAIPTRLDWWPTAVGATRARTHLVELGIPQQSLINEALSAILDGSVGGRRGGGRRGQALGPVPPTPSRPASPA